MKNSSLFECTIAPRNLKFERSFFIFFKTLKIILFIITILTAIYAFYFSNFIWLVVLVLLLLVLLVLYFQRKFYNFYDYSFCVDEIKFAKIINNKNRRLVIKFKVKDIQKIGFVTSKDFNKFEYEKNYKKVYAKRKMLDETNVYFAIDYNGENKLVIANYHSEFLSYILKKSSNNVLDGEFAETLKKYEKYNLS